MFALVERQVTFAAGNATQTSFASGFVAGFGFA